MRSTSPPAADAPALDAEGRGQLHEVGVAFQVGARQAVVVEQLLPLPDHPQVVVVDDQDLDRQLVQGRRGQLAHGHLEAAVADDGPHLLVGVGELRPHRRRHAEAHGPGAARGQPVPVLGGQAELRRPHLVLADVGGDDAVAPAQLVQPVEHVLRLAGRPSSRTCSGYCLRQAAICFSHSLESHLSTSGSRSSTTRRASPSRLTSRADDLVELGRVDVDVDLGGVGAELATACR